MAEGEKRANSTPVGTGEQQKEDPELVALVAEAKGIRSKMNDINSIYEFGLHGKDKTQEGEEITVLLNRDERDRVQEKWDDLEKDLVRICEEIYRKQGGTKARDTVSKILKDLNHHISGDTGDGHRLKVLDTILTNITEK